MDSHEDVPVSEDSSLNAVLAAIDGLLHSTSDQQRHVKRLAQDAVQNGLSSRPNLAKLLTDWGYTVQECATREPGSSLHCLQSLRHTFLVCDSNSAPSHAIALFSFDHFLQFPGACLG
jgi:hypothetical protein